MKADQYFDLSLLPLNFLFNETTRCNAFTKGVAANCQLLSEKVN